MNKIKIFRLVLLTLFLASCITTKNKHEISNGAIKQPMICSEAAAKIYAELSESDKAKLQAFTTIQELRVNQRSRSRVYIDSPYYSYSGVNESCAAIEGKKKVHFEILPMILTEWVWTIVRSNI